MSNIFGFRAIMYIHILMLAVGIVAGESFATAGHRITASAVKYGQEVQSTSKNPESPSNSWRGLVPMKSTRRDVESQLGKPSSSLPLRHSISVYETNEETIDVLYSEGPCILSGSERWSVAKDVVITIEIRPKKKMLIQELRLDPVRFPRFQRPHPENWFVYRNAADGFMVETIRFRREEQVYIISYFPNQKDGALGCTNP